MGTVLIGGTLLGSNEGHVVDGGKTIVITLQDGIFFPAVMGTDVQMTQDLIDNIDSNKAEATGWDIKVKAVLTFSDVVRNSPLQVVVTLPAFATYDITADELITVSLVDGTYTTEQQLDGQINEMTAFTSCVGEGVANNVTPKTGAPGSSQEMIAFTDSGPQGAGVAGSIDQETATPPDQQMLLFTQSIAALTTKVLLAGSQTDVGSLGIVEL